MTEKNLAQFIAEYSAVKKERDAGFAELMEAAVRAGNYAAAGVSPGQVRGAAWVRLADGRSAFARFARERHRLAPESPEGRWLRGNREMGNYLPAPLEYLNQARAWARAVAEELCQGDIAVTAGHRAIGEAGSTRGGGK